MSRLHRLLVPMLLLLLTLALLPPAARGALAPSLDAPRDFATAANPYAPAHADVNGDGHEDLLVPCLYSDVVSVLLGNGWGGFAPRANFGVGTQPNGVAAADLDRDGDLDLVSFNRGGSVSVLLGDGHGAFALHVDYSAGPTPYPGAVGDVNGDGKPDVVYPNNTGNTISIMLGAGDGTLLPRTTLAAGANLGTVVLADVNRDGRLDVVVNRHTDMLVFLGHGDGTFDAPLATPAQAHVGTPAVADLNGDGRLDLAWAHAKGTNPVPTPWFDDSVYVALGNGDGTFAAPGTWAVDNWPQEVCATDMNGDGRTDLVCDNWGSSTIVVLLGNGDGTFQPKLSFATTTRPNRMTVADVNHDGRPDPIVSVDQNYHAAVVSVLLNRMPWPGVVLRGATDYAVAANPYTPAHGDVNGDGKEDLLVPAFNAGRLSVLLGDGLGAFAPRTDVPVGSQPNGVATGDLNRDGRLDVVTFNRGGTISVLLGQGAGTFAPHVDYPGGPTPYPGAVGDVNGDAIPDVVYPNNTGGTLSILLGAGDGTFGPRTTIAAGADLGAVVLADVNRDGRRDIVVNRHTDFAVFLGHGDGTFDAPLPTGAQAHVGTPALGDLNGDGVLDVAWAHAKGTHPVPDPPFSDSVYVALGHGDGTFGAPAVYEVDNWPQEVCAGDVNGDGKLDLMCDTWGSNTVVLLLGKGDGSFFPHLSFPTTARPNRMTMADFDRDGRLDAAVSVDQNYHAPVVSVLLAGQIETLVATTGPGEFAVASNPYVPTTAQVDHDGRGDLLVPCFYANAVSVLFGKGDGTFPERRDFAVGTNPNGIATGDLNHDGDLDVVTFNRAGTVSVLLGNGDRTFRARVDYAGGLTPYPGDVRDLNGDGHADIVYPNTDAATVSILFGNGDGTFQPRVTLPASPNPSSVTAADVNADGKPDLVVNAHDRVCFHPGNGDGTFAPWVFFTAQAHIGNPAVGDLNGDGKLDLAWAHAKGTDPVPNPPPSDSLYVALGHGDFTFDLPTTWAVDNWPQSVAIGDLDGDGKQDLVCDNWGSASVVLLRGNGDGTFQTKQSYPAPARTNGMALGDLNNDGHKDVVVSVDQNYHAPVLGVLLNHWVTSSLDVPVSAQAGPVDMSRPHPNPAPGATAIEFTLAVAAEVNLHVFDVAGRVVATLAKGRMPAGTHSVRWDGRTAAGEPASAGVYFAVLDSRLGRVSRMVILTR